MNDVIERELAKFQEKIDELYESGEDWVDDTLEEAFGDVIDNFPDSESFKSLGQFADGEEFENFVKEKGIGDVQFLITNDIFDDKHRQAILKCWAESLSELTDIEIDLEFE